MTILHQMRPEIPKRWHFSTSKKHAVRG